MSIIMTVFSDTSHQNAGLPIIFLKFESSG